MRKLVIGVLAAVGLVLSAVAAIAIYANSEYTVCYGLFETRPAAARAAEAGRRAGFTVVVDDRRRESAVEFETGETGGDARGARAEFTAILRRERGKSGHGDTGCLEREPFDH